MFSRFTLLRPRFMSTAAAVPRPSASLVVLNPRNEILFVQRNPEARSFGGVHVFPGGNFDQAHDDSLADTAIRETFEEAGLLFASRSGSPGAFPDNATLDEARKAIHANQTPWKEFLSKYQLKADTQALLPFTQWITPKFATRRFQTQFFITFLDPSADFSSGHKEERLPTPDGGLEVLSARFLHPHDALSMFAAREITLMPPQFYIIRTLADLLASGKPLRDQVERLARGAFGRQVINPARFVPPEGLEKGVTVLTYEGDESRGGPKGRLHRAVVKMDKAGVTTELRLLRNFDIFTDLDAPSTSSKL